MASTIDTLRLAKRFKDVRLSDEQAELFAEVFRETQEAGAAQLAGKADLERTEAALRADLERTEAALRADLERTEATLRSELERTALTLRADLERLEVTLRADLERVERTTRADLERTELALRRDLVGLEAKIAEAKFDLLKWIVPLVAAQLLALVGLYFK